MKKITTPSEQFLKRRNSGKIMDSSIAGSMNCKINMNSTIAESMKDNIK
jgi:hypothetical protein